MLERKGRFNIILQVIILFQNTLYLYYFLSCMYQVSLHTNYIGTPMLCENWKLKGLPTCIFRLTLILNEYQILQMYI